ncbi:hypothetical protein HK096_001739, partial [Nowakowskiella sp. JEL0078]
NFFVVDNSPADLEISEVIKDQLYVSSEDAAANLEELKHIINLVDDTSIPKYPNFEYFNFPLEDDIYQELKIDSN